MILGRAWIRGAGRFFMGFGMSFPRGGIGARQNFGYGSPRRKGPEAGCASGPFFGNVAGLYQISNGGSFFSTSSFFSVTYLGMPSSS